MASPSHPTILAVALATLGAVAAFALMAAPEAAVTPAGGEADDAPPEAAPGNAFRFQHEHAFLHGEANATFDVPENPLPARIAVWFEGAQVTGSATVRMVGPQGDVLLETRNGSSIQVSVGGKNNVQGQGGIVLAPGTYRVEYRGSSTIEGHAVAHSL